MTSLGSPERSRLMDADSTNVLYSQRHLLFLRETTLMAQAFDPDRLALAGEPFPVAEQIQTIGGPPFGFMSASDSGVLTYQTGTASGAPQLTWLDRAGKVLTTVGAPALYGGLALSPDQKKASIMRADQGQGAMDIWLLDLERDGLPTRFTFDAAADVAPVWSPDGSRVAFSSSRQGNLDLYQKASSGAGAEEVLLADDGDSIPIKLVARRTLPSLRPRRTSKRHMGSAAVRRPQTVSVRADAREPGQRPVFPGRPLDRVHLD